MINISIDLTKIDKSRIIAGKNGQKYYNLTVDLKQAPDQFGYTHMVYQSPTKEERTAKVAKVYVGSGKEFVFNNQVQQAQQQNAAPAFQPSPDDTDSLPF
jgi:hypothetical protein